MISPLNPMDVLAVTYEYLFYPPSSDRLRPPAQRMARVLLLKSSTLGTFGHRLHPIILDMTGSLQQQMAGEPYTPYEIRPHHSRLKGRGYQPKKNQSWE
jgi:hypothetical protein